LVTLLIDGPTHISTARLVKQDAMFTDLCALVMIWQ